jgi:excisionase family DNA binding protein
MELLTVQETARLLRLTPMTVRRYIAAGRLPAVRVGRRVRVERDAVQALVEPFKPGIAPDSGFGSGDRQPHIRRLTDQEVQQGLAAMKEAARLREEMRARRGGATMPESWALIREAREERDAQL